MIARQDVFYKKSTSCLLVVLGRVLTREEKVSYTDNNKSLKNRTFYSMNRSSLLLLPKKNDGFHVHTFRCGHAENVSDEEYVKKAMELETDAIWFSDHAPFPGDPFGNRMKYEQLDEYLNTLNDLKKEYEGQIRIMAGLEIEYFPSFDTAGYYKELRCDKRLDFLLLGQHMAEDAESGNYSFSWDKERLRVYESQALGDAILQGMETGYFDFIAHPDRIFRRKKAWDGDMEKIAVRIIQTAIKHHIPLEKNLSSMRQENHYRPEFWKIAEMMDVEVITGLDAHWIADMERKNILAGDEDIFNTGM